MSQSEMAQPPRDDETDDDEPDAQRLRMARAVEANWCAAWASLGKLTTQPHSLDDDTPTMLRVLTPGVPETLMNIVMRYRSPEPVTTAAIEEIIEPFRYYGLPFQWWLIRDDAPAGLRERLYDVGMRSWGGATMMYLDLRGWDVSYPQAPPSVSYQRATSDADLADALHIISRVFDAPPFPMSRWTSENPAFALYLAHWGHQAVATVATLPLNESIGVYHVATMPDARRRGIAGSLLLLALREAQAAGFTSATLTATPEGQRIYEYLGFRVCGLLEQWMTGPQLTNDLIRRGDPRTRWNSPLAKGRNGR
jgi:GNAT superfamily N-acetyltransferase